MRVKIISTPPGLGKSYFCKWRESFNCLDTDSSNFSKDNFPNNYCDAIEERYNSIKNIKYDKPADLRVMDFLDTLIVDELIDEMNKDKTVACFYMFISNHKEVLQELDNRGIPYIVVYPEKELKNEVLNRIYTRNTEQPNKQIGDRFNKEFDIWYKEWINAKNKIACTKQFPTITDLFKEGLL